MVTIKTRKENRYRGVVAAEAALVLPLLLLITFAAIKYGWLFWKGQQITSAARHGARMAILQSAETALVEQEILDLYDWIEAGDIDFDPDEVDQVAPGDTLTVTLEVPVDRVDIMNLRWLPEPNYIRASITMAKEGPM